MNSNVQRYRNQLLVARILAGRYSLELIVKEAAATAATDGQRIIFPAGWMLVDNDDVATVMDGIIDHEAAGHGRHTDFRARRSRRPIVNRMENILEDIRIELAAGVDWPGIPRNLERAIGVLVRWGVFGDVDSLSSPDVAPGALLCNAMLLNCRARFLPKQSEHLGSLAEVSAKAARIRFGTAWDSAWKLAQKAPTLTSTKEACKLAAQIVESFSLPAEKNEPPAAVLHVPGAAGEPGVATDAVGHDPSEVSDQHGSDPTPAQRAAVAATLDATSAELPKTDLGDLAGAAVNDHSADVRRRVPLQIPKEASGTEPVPYSWRILATRLRNSLAGDLAAELDTLVSRRRLFGYTGRDLASGKLYRLRLGDGRVFKKRQEVYELNTAITLLADVSSSMGTALGLVERVTIQPASSSQTSYSDGSRVVATQRYSVTRMDVAGGAAIAIGEVLEHFEVPNEVIGFGRAYQVIKSFEDAWSSVDGSSNAVTLRASVTATGMAMTIALSRLELRDEARKLLIVLTDGEAADLEMLASAYAYARYADIEVVTIFIGGSVRGLQQTRHAMQKGGYAGQMSVVNSHTELPEKVVEAVRRSI
ncbi:hypothetical protein ACN8ZM_39775 (plasmid) [Burkholderia aenigmatica]|uniref:hypothetical protein n=1 Tax=Burkholderia aenigmatica TaxID=2015348 RepID=UPI003B43B41D